MSGWNSRTHSFNQFLFGIFLIAVFGLFAVPLRAGADDDAAIAKIYTLNRLPLPPIGPTTRPALTTPISAIKASMATSYCNKLLRYIRRPPGRIPRASS